MDSNQNKLAIMHAYELYQQGDIKGVIGACCEDVAVTVPENEHVPYTGHFHGHYGLAEFFSKMAETSEPLSFTPRDFIAEGDKVVVTGSARWHVKSTGRDFGSDWVHVFTMRDGKVARFEQHSDTAAAEAAFRGAPLGTTEGAVLRH